MTKQEKLLKNARPSDVRISRSKGGFRPKINVPDNELVYKRDLKSVSGAVVALLGGLTVPIMLFSAFMNKAQSISILHSDLINNFSISYFNDIVLSMNLDAQVGTFFGGFLNYIGNVSTFIVNKLSGLTDILSNLADLPSLLKNILNWIVELLQNLWNWASNLFS